LRVAVLADWGGASLGAWCDRRFFAGFVQTFLRRARGRAMPLLAALDAAGVSAGLTQEIRSSVFGSHAQGEEVALDEGLEMPGGGPLTLQRLLGLAAEQLAGLDIEKGREVAELHAKHAAQNCACVPIARVRVAGGAATNVLVQCPERIWESAWECARRALEFCEDCGFRAFRGPMRVLGPTGLPVGGLDGVCAHREHGSTVLDMQVVERCRTDKRLDQKRAWKKGVMTDALRAVGAAPARHGVEVRAASAALAITVECDASTQTPDVPSLTADLYRVCPSSLRKIKGWTRRGEHCGPPTERKSQKSTPSGSRGAPVAKDIAKRLGNKKHFPDLGDGLVLIKPYVAQRWTAATAEAKLKAKVEFLAKQWRWKVGKEVHKMVLSCGGGKGGEWVCKRTALQAAHGKEFGL
jgi:hypothetical protein